MQPKRTRTDETRRPRGAEERPSRKRGDAGWTTDATISAGVLGALACLCVGVVGWRFVDSRYFGATPIASAPAVESTAAPPKDKTPQAIYASPQIGHGALDPLAPSASTVAGGAASPAAPSYDHLPPGTLTSSTAAPLPSYEPRTEQPPFAAELPPTDGPGYANPSNASYESAAYATASRPSAVEIQPGDSFWLISERAYGTGAYFKALYRYHEAAIPEPDRLPTGQRLEIPPAETLRELFPEDVPADAGADEVARLRSYRTRRGDTALSVAEAQLGDASRWTDVFRLNQRAVTSPDAALPEGYELKLPPAPRMAATPATGGVSSSPSTASPVR